ncbi:class I SAM-dependent methyltransferase [uncultured Victivallis sp.]|uniref:class I SAM-dependent methyltransferase n=1 Tax=uncultured Victivallis sp. TaxID=354118 RepID=UPI0025DCF812|nr:class I SAM-dependent methyltransferase [uncultured Victivallis sp.]
MKYELLDSGNLQKLEQVGEFRLVRPALNAFWRPGLPRVEWEAADAVFTRDSSGGGHWSFRRKLPESWMAEWGGFTLKIKPTGFGHLGFFAEQYRNWDFFRSADSGLKEGVRALNLFGYSGVGSMAMAATGASVCHLDASRGMIEWGKENLTLNPQVPSTIRWIADDVNKFTQRELRRGNSYNLIALDPPTFGRGSSGQLWKIEEDLPKLLNVCNQLREPGRPFTVILSCHSPGFSCRVLERLLVEACGRGGEFESFEMTIPESTGRELPAGISVRYTVAHNRG